MRKTLTLSKETLRILDDDELALVAGGADPSDKKKGHGKTGNSGHCQANKKKSQGSSCP
jgi:hypothetical protein